MRVNIQTIMQAIPSDWRYTWCESEVCGCLGCANRSGGATASGVLKSEWQKWVKDNPNMKNNTLKPYIHQNINKILTTNNGDVPECKDETNL